MMGSLKLDTSSQLKSLPLDFSVSNDISLTLTVVFPLSFFVGCFIFSGKGHTGTIANASKYSKKGTTYNSTSLSSSSYMSVILPYGLTS
jgi:hypothetical protein